MWAFNATARFRRRLRARERAAYLIEEDLSLQAQLGKNLQLAIDAVGFVKDDEAMYERLLDKTTPNTLAAKLQEELLRWMHVRDTLRNLSGRDMLPDLYRREIAQLRPDVNALYRLADEVRLLFDQTRSGLPNQLPIVKIRGKKYYRDDRLREFRRVEDPHERIPF